MSASSQQPTNSSSVAAGPNDPSLARRVLATVGILGLVVVLAVVFARRRELT